MITYHQPTEGSSLRHVLLDGCRIGVENLGRRRGRWVAYGGPELDHHHRAGFPTRKAAAEWLRDSQPDEKSFDWRAHFAQHPSPMQRRARAAGTSVLHQVHRRASEAYAEVGDITNATAARRATERTP